MFPWGLFIVTCLPAFFVFYKQSKWFDKNAWNWLLCFLFIFLNGFFGMIVEIVVVVYFSDSVLEGKFLKELQGVIMLLTLGVSGLFQYIVMLLRYQMLLKKQEDSWVS